MRDEKHENIVVGDARAFQGSDVATKFVGRFGRVSARLEYKVNRIHCLILLYYIISATLSLATSQESGCRLGSFKFCFTANACFDREKWEQKLSIHLGRLLPSS